MSEPLPSGWTVSSIGALGRYVNGRGFGKNEWRTRGLPIIRIQNLNDESAPFNFTDQEHENKYRVTDGDLLVAWAASLGVYLWRRGPAWLNQHIFRVEVNEDLVSKPFLYWSLKHALDALYKKTHGSGMVHVTRDRFDSHPIALPPKAEQERIVSRIEELFSEIDEGERALERVQKLVERYRQSALKAAFTGELTRDWRRRNQSVDHAADRLLQQIAAARRAGSRGSASRYVEPASPDTSGLGGLPESWQWAAVEQLCFVETGATPKRGEAKYYAGGTIPWVTSGAVNKARITEPTELITQRAIAETNAKVFPAGTLLVAMYGEGKTRGKVSELGIEAATNQACAALLVASLPSAVRRHVRLFFEKHYEELRDHAAGGVQPNLNLSIIKQTVLPLPPLEEVQEICDRVDACLSESAAVGAEVARRRASVSALRQSVLKAAFSGQLVPQDSSEEPASALLARLAAQAGNTPSVPRRRGRRAALAQP